MDATIASEMISRLLKRRNIVSLILNIGFYATFFTSAFLVTAINLQNQYPDLKTVALVIWAASIILFAVSAICVLILNHKLSKVLNQNKCDTQRKGCKYK